MSSGAPASRYRHRMMLGAMPRRHESRLRAGYDELGGWRALRRRYCSRRGRGAILRAGGAMMAMPIARLRQVFYSRSRPLPHVAPAFNFCRCAARLPATAARTTGPFRMTGFRLLVNDGPLRGFAIIFQEASALPMLSGARCRFRRRRAAGRGMPTLFRAPITAYSADTRARGGVMMASTRRFPPFAELSS